MTAIYLIQYGRSAFVGRFRGVGPEVLPRDAPVVVRGPRGLELGTVLCVPADRFARADELDGDLVRLASAADFAAAARLDDLGRDILAAAEARAAGLGLPVNFVDVEVSLDGASAVLHGLPWGGCDASPLFAELSDRFGRAVRLFDLSREHGRRRARTCGGRLREAGVRVGRRGCSSCGSGAGGCSTSSCSRGKVKSADDLTAYFSDLRRKMEAQATSRTPLA